MTIVCELAREAPAILTMACEEERCRKFVRLESAAGRYGVRRLARGHADEVRRAAEVPALLPEELQLRVHLSRPGSGLAGESQRARRLSPALQI